jgi:hypothetical protein
MERRIIILLFTVMVIFSFTSAEAESIVGQNNPAVDIQAIQKAVDQGGTILLKGTFDFGDKGRVNITKDVKIIGETDDKGTPITKIKGGFWTFHSPLPSQLPVEIQGPKITIQKIHFDGASWGAIHVAYCSALTITNNKMTNVKPVPSPVPLFGQTGKLIQMAIIGGTIWAQPKEPRKFQPGAVVGNLIIADNHIDVNNENPVNTMSQGMFIAWTSFANAQISGNTIYHCSRNSIEAIDNFLDKDGNGTVFIKDNKIVTSQIGIPLPSPNTPNGILVGWFFDPSGAFDPKRNPKYVIVNNGIRTRGQTSYGIGVYSDNAVISNNAVLAEGSEAVGIRNTSCNSYIAHNRIEGRGAHAIRIEPMRGQLGSKNFLVGNDFSQFKASRCDVAFEKDSKNNVVCGSSGTVVDEGSGNQIEGLKSVAK